MARPYRKLTKASRRVHVSPAVSQDSREREPQLLRQLPDFLLRFIDHVAAGLAVLTCGEGLPDGEDPAATPVAGVEHDGVGALKHEIASRRKPSQSGTDYEHADAGQRSGPHICSTLYPRAVSRASRPSGPTW